MIIFDLMCEEGHAFEGWFKDHETFKDQLEKGLIQCPTCGSYAVSQALSTRGMIRTRGEGAQVGGLPTFLQALRKVIETHFEDVGSEFATKALKIHYGVEEARNIRGTSTDEEERILRDEGVAFLKIPLPPSSEDSNLN